jgi:hypothetical protein
VLMQQVGAQGAIWGMSAGSIVLTILIWKEIWNGKNDRN